MQYRCDNCFKINPLPVQRLEQAECIYCNNSQITPAAPWANGAILGFRFAVIHAIGKGGHGYVCLCRDLIEDRTCVLKIFHRENLKKEVIEAFYNEAQVARGFKHPNIVRTYGGSMDGRVLFLVQDWICGVDLIRYEKKIGRFTLNQLLVILLKCCKALKYIWENHHLIHRDIKPENILLNHQGESFLTDFGIMSPPMDSDPANQLFCTPEYVAPEVASGDQAIDFRSDIYSLGAAFFRLISGYPPFKGQDNSSTIVQRFNGSPDLRSYCDVNRALAELILKMMSLSADERHQSYDELIQETEHTITTLNKETQYYIQGLEDLPHVE